MTDHDTIARPRLTNLEQYILDKGYEINTDGECPNGFSYLDFKDVMDEGTFRNKIANLRKLKLAYIYIKSRPTYYAIRGSGLDSKKMTDDPIVGKSSHVVELIQALAFLGDRVTGVHDIHLTFSFPKLYEYAAALNPQAQKMDREIMAKSLQKKRRITVCAHNSGTVSVMVKCTEFPFSPNNLCELYAVLEQVRDELSFNLPKAERMPLAGDWLVVTWHYNIDGGEIDGERFNLTFRDYSGVFSRIYSKRLSGDKLHARIERIEAPGRSLTQLGGA